MAEKVELFVGDVLYLAVLPAVYLASLFRDEPSGVRVTEDEYYQPPEPGREWEAEGPCDSCEYDTLHVFTVWQPYRECTRECLVCGQLTEVDE